MQKKNAWVIVAIILVAGVAAAYFGGVEGDDIKLLTYPVQCIEHSPASFQNCATPLALGRSEYVVQPKMSRVISSQIDDPESPLSAYEGCVIVDSSNWSCGSYSSFGFKNGKPFDNGFDDRVIFVSRAQWNSINDGSPSSLEDMLRVSDESNNAGN